jgi:glutathione S-transferase
VAAVLHVGFDYLDRLPARLVPVYAVEALEREARETLRWLTLFQIPLEAWGGRQRPLFHGLRNQAAHWLGQGTIRDKRGEEERERERQLIAQVEAEIARDFPIYNEPDRLDLYHKQVGAWK